MSDTNQPLFELTPDQRVELERQKAASPSGRRVSLELTEDQRRCLREAADAEQSHKDENIAAYRRMLAAEREPTLSGDLRRAIKSSGRRPSELAELVGLTPLDLDAFRCGDKTLPSNVLDRLAAALGMTLVSTASHEADPSGTP
jgi:hypothetical protein